MGVATSGTCEAPYVPAERPEEAVLTTIQDIVLSDEHLAQLVKVLKEEVKVSVEKKRFTRESSRPRARSGQPTPGRTIRRAGDWTASDR